MKKIAFLGLGVMGFPMAGHLQNAGFDTTVYNRTRSKAEDWVKMYGGHLAATPAEAVKSADVVFACVGNDDDLQEVCLGETGAFSEMAPNAIFVDHTTVSAKISRVLYLEAKERGISFMDAPVSGGQAGAENGQLSIMCGGDAEVFEAVKDVLKVYGKICKRLGLVGAGQICKMSNQIAIAGLIQGLAEALNFAEKAGLDGAEVVEVIAHGAAGSWQMQNRYKTMIADEYNHGFAVDLMRKDLGIVFQAADEIGASLPVTALVDQFYKDVQAIGGGRWDTSSLLKLLRR